MVRMGNIFAAVGLAALVGCASGPKTALPILPATIATAAPKLPSQAKWTLDEILPKPELGTPATVPSQPSLDALQLYARARAALVDQERFTAINLLESAIKLDPESFELYNTLGKAYLAAGGNQDKAIEAMENAAHLEPDHLLLQYELGRQYLLRAEKDPSALPKSVEHLRLAVQTNDYRHDDDLAILTDFFLARALQQAGYLRAALDRYQMLLDEVKRPVSRGAPELSYLIAHPEVIEVQVGELQDDLGNYKASRAAYEEALAHDPDNYLLRTRVIRAMFNEGNAQARGMRPDNSSSISMPCPMPWIFSRKFIAAPVRKRAHGPGGGVIAPATAWRDVDPFCPDRSAGAIGSMGRG